MRRALRWRRSRGSRAGPAAAAILIGVILLTPAPAVTQHDAVPLSAAEVRDRWHSRLDGRHFVASVRMEMVLAGMEEERQMTIVRDDVDGDRERVLIRFDAPEDLRGVGILYLEQNDRPNDYFLYQPATRRVRRLPSTVADDDVYGVDLEFLGFGVARTEPTEIRSMRRERLGGRDVYRLHEVAQEWNPRFEDRTTWIDAETFLPLRTEHRRKGEVVLVAETRRSSRVQGVVTPLELYFEKAGERRQVLLRVDAVEYDKPIPDEHFSILELMKSRLRPR